MVTVDGVPLAQRRDVLDLGAHGFEWGYEGSGPHQLSLAVLADHFDDPSKAREHYRSFCEGVVARLSDPWVVSSPQIDAALLGVVRVDMTLDDLLKKLRGG